MEIINGGGGIKSLKKELKSALSKTKRQIGVIPKPSGNGVEQSHAEYMEWAMLDLAKNEAGDEWVQQPDPHRMATGEATGAMCAEGYCKKN